VGAWHGPGDFPFAALQTRYATDEKARAMKSLARPSFFRLFDLLLSLTNPGLKRSHWTHDGVDFERERHSVMGPKHGLAIEIFTLRRPGRRGWSLMVTKEYWWAGEESKALKNLRWARPISGQRADILSWLRTQEARIGRESFVGDNVADTGDDGELAAIEDGDSS
jgi:hypothetical protein